MTVIVDGYKLWRARDGSGERVVIAAINAIDLIDRAAARGVQVDERTIGWHELYRQIAATSDVFDRQHLEAQVAEAIYNDVAEYP